MRYGEGQFFAKKKISEFEIFITGKLLSEAAFFGFPSFFNYAIKREALRGLSPTGMYDFQLWFEFR